MTRINEWRLARGYTYQQMAELIGCSRQYAQRICLEGTAGAVKAVKLLAVAQGDLRLEDFLTAKDREMLIQQGFIGDDDLLV